MPFDFNEYGAEEEAGIEQQDEALESVVNELEASPATIDEHMSEVEKRLEIATYYRMLLNDSLFNVSNQAAKTVETEVRGFIRSRLGVLLNIEQAPAPTTQAPSTFSDEETQALKALAAKVLSKPAVLVTPAIKPALNKALVAKPGVGTVAIVKKNVPPMAQIVDSTVNKQQSTSKRKFKTVEHNGKQVKMNTTGQVRGSGGIPMPTPQAMSSVTAAKALESVNSFRGTSNVLNNAIENATKQGD